jgi:hypothetical protein
LAPSLTNTWSCRGVWMITQRYLLNHIYNRETLILDLKQWVFNRLILEMKILGKPLAQQVVRNWTKRPRMAKWILLWICLITHNTSLILKNSMAMQEHLQSITIAREGTRIIQISKLLNPRQVKSSREFILNKFKTNQQVWDQLTIRDSEHFNKPLEERWPFKWTILRPRFNCLNRKGAL